MKPDMIVLHHSTSVDHPTLDWQGIRRYHIVDRGYKDCGYHFGIEQVNEGFEIVVGRMVNEIGAHCVAKGVNRRSIGICFIGDFTNQPPTERQWELGVRLVTGLCILGDIPATNIYGHREWANTECPGKAFDLGKFRAEVLLKLIHG